MKRKGPEKIPTDGPSTPLASPFASLNISVSEEQTHPSQTPAAQAQTQPATAPRVLNNGTVLLQRQTAHRHGGCVIVLRDFSRPHNSRELDALARDLKKHCGTGGTVKDRTIEIQGEHIPKIRARLTALGYTPRGEK